MRVANARLLARLGAVALLCANAWCDPLQGDPAAGDRCRIIAVELTGPLESFAFDLPTGGRTEVRLILLEGERRELLLPLPSRPPVAYSPQAIGIVPAAGGVRFLEWVQDGRGERWNALPFALRSRTRPPASAPQGGGDLLGLSLVLAGGALVLGLRRKPLLAGIAGCAAVAAVVLLADWTPPVVPPVLLLEGAAGSGDWLRVEATYGRASWPAEAPLRVELASPELRMTWEASDAGWVASAPRTAVLRLDEFAPGMRRVERGLNSWGLLERVWTRDEQGRWSEHGPWALGLPLPPAAEARTMPPGWLVSALPQGTSVLVARAAGSFWGGAEPSAGAPVPERDRWVRISPFR